MPRVQAVQEHTVSRQRLAENIDERAHAIAQDRHPRSLQQPVAERAE